MTESTIITGLNISLASNKDLEKKITEQGEITCAIMAHMVNSAKCAFPQHQLHQSILRVSVEEQFHTFLLAVI